MSLTPPGQIGHLHRPITEDWLREHEFRLSGERNDGRHHVRRLAVATEGIDGRQMFESPDDLCIDVAKSFQDNGQWHVWIQQIEPYRTIHVRHMRYTWEIARLYEGLTGVVWPGTL